MTTYIYCIEGISSLDITLIMHMIHTFTSVIVVILGEKQYVKTSLFKC